MRFNITGRPPFLTTQDIWSQGALSVEIHYLMQMLSVSDKLTWASVPLGLDKITGADGSSKKLIDCAGRHIPRLKEWLVDPITEETDEKLAVIDEKNEEADDEIPANDKEELDEDIDMNIKNNKYDDNEIKQLEQLFLHWWVRHTGDGPYSKPVKSDNNSGVLKADLLNLSMMNIKLI